MKKIINTYLAFFCYVFLALRPSWVMAVEIDFPDTGNHFVYPCNLGIASISGSKFSSLAGSWKYFFREELRDVLLPNGGNPDTQEYNYVIYPHLQTNSFNNLSPNGFLEENHPVFKGMVMLFPPTIQDRFELTSSVIGNFFNKKFDVEYTVIFCYRAPKGASQVIDSNPTGFFSQTSWKQTLARDDLSATVYPQLSNLTVDTWFHCHDRFNSTISEDTGGDLVFLGPTVSSGSLVLTDGLNGENIVGDLGTHVERCYFATLFKENNTFMDRPSSLQHTIFTVINDVRRIEEHHSDNDETISNF